MTVFQQRATTAIVFSAVMLTGLFWNAWSFHLLFLIIATGCVWEFLDMTLPNDDYKKLRKIIGAGAGFLIVALKYYHFLQFLPTFAVPKEAYSVYLFNGIQTLNVLLFTSFLLLIIELFLKSELPFNNVGLIALSLIYIAVPFSLFSHEFTFSFTPNLHFSPNIIAGILFLTWANDSFAYIVGSKIGKTPFFLRISPKKTWEGTIGGAVFCMITAAIIAQFFKQLDLIDWLVIGAIIAIFGTIGDLVESLLKRSVGVKDSGSFMPGHGGFLDRFDAFIFCIPFVYFYLSVVKHLF
jgi:phosphatidate cytidylyltransferase